VNLPVRTPQEAGFTLIEMVVAIAITMAVMAAIVMVVNSAQAAFQAQGEVPELQQRLRASIEMLTRDVRNAGGVEAPVRPYRVGAVRDDFAAGVYYRTDTITVFYASDGALMAGTPVVATHTYYLRPHPASDTFDLMLYDGIETDLPVVDHVVGLTFQYFGDPGSPKLLMSDDPDSDPVELNPAILVDGPWWDEKSGVRKFDADLVRLRCVAVTLRVRSPLGERFVPDLEIRFRIALRNMMSGT
jgi:type II secretory pathway pseudopilin PulG